MAASIIPVPIGKGIDRASDEYLIPPPSTYVAQNVRLTKRGAYEKRPGGTFETTLGGNAHGFVTAVREGRNAEEIVVYGNTGGSVYSEGGTTRDMTYGALLPTEVRTHPCWNPNGTVLAVNIAHSGGYTAVCATVSKSTELITVTNDQAVVGEIAIFDSDWKLAYGPFTVPELAWLPRVEPLVEADQVGFLFLGLYDPNPAAPDDSALRSDDLSLYGVYVIPYEPGFPTPVLIDATVLGNAVPWAATTDFKHVWYDTHSREGDRVFITFWRDAGDSIDCALIKGTIDSSVVLTSSTLLVQTIATVTSIACWYDELTDTFLVYNEADKNFYVSDQDLASPSTVAGPAAPNDIPVFYEDNSQNLNLTNYPISLVGTNPAAPVTLTAETSSPPLHRRPMPHTGHRWLFTRLKTTERQTREIASVMSLWDESPDTVTGMQELEILESEAVDGEDTLSAVVPLNANRQPWRVRDNWHGLWAGNLADVSAPDSHVAGTVGQAARSGTHTYLIPQAISVPVYLADDRTITPEPLSDLTVPNNNPVGIYTTMSEHSRAMMGTNAFWTDQTYIVVNEVLTEDVSSSSIGLNGSTLIAAGNLHVYDGQNSFEPCPEAVNIYVRRGDDFISSGVGDVQDPAQPGWGYQRTDAGEGVEWKCFLVYTDINGVKYRSDACSARWEDAGAAAIAPLFEIDLLPSHLPHMYAGNGWGLEVYKSDVYTIDTGIPDYTTPASGHKWVGTLPIVWDSVNSRWTADGSNLREGSPIVVISDPPALTVTTEVAPYTDSELPNVRPPAFSVLARAGNYIFAAAYENNYEIWHTKPLADFIGPEFNPNLMLYAPVESGGVVSLAGVGDRLLILCKNGVWELFVGSGPDAAGGGAFPPFRKLWSGDGCVTHKWTISDTPFGVLFLSKSGPKLVTPEGQVVDIGAKIDGLYNTEVARCAVYDPITKEAWFFQDNSSGNETAALIYDLEMGEWTTSTFEADTAFIFRDALTRLNGSRLVVHSDDSTQDDGAAFYGKVTTPWLTLNSTQGYFRVKRIASLLRHITGTVGTLNVDLEYDYVDGVVDTFAWTATTFLTLERGMQFRMKPGTQKVDAIRITIRDSNEDQGGQVNTNTLRWVLAGITLYTEQKRGEVKLQQGASL